MLTLVTDLSSYGNALGYRKRLRMLSQVEPIATTTVGG